MAEQKFPKLSLFLQKLKNGRRQFGPRAIFHLLSATRYAREFLKDNKARAGELDDAVKEIHAACSLVVSEFDHPPDPGYIKALLWRSIKELLRTGTTAKWDGERIGSSIVESLQSAETRLQCIPLPGSVAPLRNAPLMYVLAEGVWLIEPCRSINQLLQKLDELLLPLTDEITASLRRAAKDVEARGRDSDYYNLLHSPVVACHGKGAMAQRPWRVQAYGLPLVSLHNMVTVNALDTSDSMSLFGYLADTSPAWPKELAEEWSSLCSPTHPLAVNIGESESLEPALLALETEVLGRVRAYEIHPQAEDVPVVHGDFTTHSLLPPILILPSLLDYDRITKPLIEYGQGLGGATSSDLDRRIAHGIVMWREAWSHARQVLVEPGFDFDPYDESFGMAEPDLVILFSTIVLETLLSTSNDTQEVTSRIADRTAGLLGKSPEDRYDLSARLKRAYASRSEFVHGVVDRPSDYEGRALWLFKIATLALWEAVRIIVVDKRDFKDSKQFCEYIERRKYGAADAHQA